MFYEEKPDKAFRFGDIISGYIVASPKIKQPILENKNHEYSLNIELSPYSAILSPSCSIGDKKISLVPLMKIRKSFFDNDYLKKDLTRLNRPMERKYAHNPEKHQKKGAVQEDDNSATDIVYSLVELFVYDQHDKLSPYQTRKDGVNQDIRYYMIDFRNIYKLDCDAIEKAECAPLDSKILQLSNASRTELIQKLNYYYLREIN